MGPENYNGPPIKNHINPPLTLMTPSFGTWISFFIPCGTYYPGGQLIRSLLDWLCCEALLNSKTNRK